MLTILDAGASCIQTHKARAADDRGRDLPTALGDLDIENGAFGVVHLTGKYFAGGSGAGCQCHVSCPHRLLRTSAFFCSLS